nr:MAG TPA: hypothetical protein [Crassvirales sp.]
MPKDTFNLYNLFNSAYNAMYRISFGCFSLYI